MTERTSPAVRYLASAALVVFALAFGYVLIAGGGGGGSKGAPSAGPAKAPVAPAPKPKRGHRRGGSKGTYVVKTGDSLGSIARKTGVGVRRLQELNPDVDPQLLSPGQRLKLR